MTTQDKTYNGWSTYETWLVHLWLTNDAHLVHSFGGLYDEVCEAETLFDAKEIIKNWVENELDTFLEGREAGMFVDLLRGALSEVNWYEIARHMRDEE